MNEKLHEGYLIKSSAKDSKKAGRKRWFVLYRRNNYPYLRYYKHQPRKSNDRPLFDYPIGEHSTVCRLTGTENRFTLILDQQVQLNLQADSREEAQIWISFIQSQYISDHNLNSFPTVDDMLTNAEENQSMFTLRSRTDNLIDAGCSSREQNLNGIPPNPDPPPFDPYSNPIVVKSFCKSAASPDLENEATPSQDKPLPRLVISPTNYGSTSAEGYAGIVSTRRATNRLATGQTYGPVMGAIQLLQEQIASPGGVSVQGAVNDFRSSLAVVDIDHRVWVAGWNTRCVRLHGLFHIGDQLVEMGGIPIGNAKQFYETLDALKERAGGLAVRCSLRLRRLPQAKVFAVRRTRVGQNIGLHLVEGTNQVAHVVPDGLAAQIGLPATSRPYLSESLARMKSEQHPWTITEINGQTLNLLSKKSEACVLLNAYGNDVTVVVQPTEFVKHLTQKLKKFRSCEHYIPR